MPADDTLAFDVVQLWLGASLLTKVRQEPSALDATMASTYALLGIAPGQTN